MSNNIRLTPHQHAFLALAVTSPEKANLIEAQSLFTHAPGSLKARQAAGGLMASLSRMGLGVGKDGSWKVNAKGKALYADPETAKQLRATVTPFPKKAPDTTAARVQALAAAGKTVAEIAKELGVHRSTVTRALVKAGVAAKKAGKEELL